MTINERIKFLRKDILHINQSEFAKKIGLKQNSISSIENEISSVTEQVLKSICLAFNLNEDWLRFGTEPIYTQPKTFSLDEFVKEQGATDLELELLKIYFQIDSSVRKQLLEHFTTNLSSNLINKSTKKLPSTTEEFEKLYPPIDDDESNLA